jgi:hypothetical protein
MRPLAIAMLALGCHAASTPPPAAPAASADPRIVERIGRLRATLARSGVTLDAGTAELVGCADPGPHGVRCVRCTLATPANTADVDPTVIDAVAIAFAAYPTPVFAAAQLEHVALCRHIAITGDGADLRPAGVAIAGERRLLIGLGGFVDGAPHRYDEFSIAQVVHHEVFHLLERAHAGDDRAWTALNPAGFQYRDPAELRSPRPAGFVNTYATTSPSEDRATVFEYLLGQPARLCELAATDPVVRTKVTEVWRRAATVMGDRLLQQHAPCVDWVKPAKPRPAKPRRQVRSP